MKCPQCQKKEKRVEKHCKIRYYLHNSENPRGEYLR